MRTTSLLPCTLAILGLTSPARADERAECTCTPPTDVITVDGHGKADARPDAMRARVGVEVQAKKPAEAQDGASRTAAKIVAAVKGLGVHGLTVRTEDLTLTAVYSTVTSGSAPPSIVGYRARNVVEVKAPAAPDEVGGLASKILEAAGDAGATEIAGVDTYVADDHATEARALAAAVADAERRAKAIAEEAGVSITALASLEVGASATPVPKMMRAMSAGAAASDVAPPVEAGERETEARVTARFKFATK